jgi:NADH-quinone oxidoreductase subunit F
VNKQVCVELPLGITCRALIDEHAGGVWKGRKAKAAVPGGISMGLLSADELDTPLDFESLRKPGCLGLGTAAVTVIDDQTSIVDYLYNTCRFFAHESCGQCTPCREGTTWFFKTMKRIKAGGGRLEDLDIMANLANNMGIMPGTTICGLADGAAWPIKNGVSKFRGELEEYIRTHQKAACGVTALQEKIAHGTRADAGLLPVLSGVSTAPAAALRSPASGPA